MATTSEEMKIKELHEKLRAAQAEVERLQGVERALREREQAYRELVKYAPAGIYEVDFRERKFRSVNDAMCRLLGYSREELLGLDPEEIMDEEGRVVFRERVEKWLAGEKPPEQVEFRVRRKDGGIIIASVSATFTTDEEGKPWGATAVAYDVTERKRAEAAVRESEEKYRSLFKSMEEGFCIQQVIFDEAGNGFDYRFLEMNPAFERQTGLTGAEGKTIRQLVPDIEPFWPEAYGKVVRTGKAMRFEQKSEAMGSWFDVSVSPIGAPHEHKVAVLFSDVTERKRAEEALRRAHETITVQYAEIESIYHDAPVGLCVLDREFRWVRINERMAEINGYTIEEHIGKRVPELLPHVAAAVQELFDRVMTTGEPVLNFEFQAETKAQPGVVRDFVEQWLPLRDESGEVFAINMVAEEVTERRRLEEERRQLAAIVEYSDDAMYQRDVSGIIRTWNEGAEEMYGYSAAEAIGRSIVDLIVPEDRLAELEEIHKRLRQGEGVVGLETVRKRRDGEWIDTALTLSPIADEGEEVVQVAVVARDITESKRLRAELAMSYVELSQLNESLQTANEDLAAFNEEMQTTNEELKRRTLQLEEANGRIRRILGSITECYLLLDKDWQILDMNANSEQQIFGGPKERFVGTRLWNLTKADLEKNEFYRQYRAAFEQGRAVHFEAQSNIAENRWLEVHAYPSEDRETLSVYFRDISERKRAELNLAIANEELAAMNEELQTANEELGTANEEIQSANDELREKTMQLQAANRLLDVRTREAEEANERLLRANQDLLDANEELGRFGSFLSHDLRAPLRAIRGFGEILQEDYAEVLDADGQELIERMVGAAENAGEIIANMQRLTGLDASSFAPEEFDLREIVQEWHEHLCASRPERECRLEIAGELMVKADRRMMTIALTNLLENAYKYAAEREAVEITFGCDDIGGRRCFYVKDNGVGFDMDRAAEKLFKPFSRLHAGSKYSGTGLGLAIVRKVISRHGGRVWAESAEGEGATFWFTLG